MTARDQDPNMQILRALGITQRRVVAVDLSLRPGQPPRLMLDCVADPRTMLHEVLAFDLVPRPPMPEPAPALDLDAMCAAAKQRIAEAADNAAYRAKCEHLGDSKLIRARLDKAIDAHKQTARRALAMLASEDGTAAATFNSKAYPYAVPTRLHHWMDEAIKACPFTPGEFLTLPEIMARLDMPATYTNAETLFDALMRAGFTPRRETTGHRRRGFIAPARGLQS
ncbi:hypothetical protein [Acidovorax sp. Q11]